MPQKKLFLTLFLSEYLEQFREAIILAECNMGKRVVVEHFTGKFWVKLHLFFVWWKERSPPPDMFNLQGQQRFYQEEMGAREIFLVSK